MQIDITFDYAKVFNVSRMNVVKGRSFSFRLPHHFRLFSDNDDILSIGKAGCMVSATAANLGHSTLLIINREFDIVKHLSVTVVASVQPQAGDLGLIADKPVNK